MYRTLALATSILTSARIIYFQMTGWVSPWWWSEVCAVIGAVLLFWVGTQKLKYRTETWGVGLLGGLLMMVNELPFVSALLHNFLPEGGHVVELLAAVPLLLCCALLYFALRGFFAEPVN